MIARFVLLSLAVLLSGCAEFNSIYRVRHVTADAAKAQAQVITVDAKQRHLLISPELAGKDKSVNWRRCAEAAPDVFSAYAASLAAKGDKSGGQLSLGGSETAATIERTQTVNLLRESMYRTCERFLSGALGKDQFIVQAARDQRSMVAVLAVEQLTGAIRAKPTIISGPATSASIIDGDKVAELVTLYTEEKKAAVAARDTAKGNFDTANAGIECDTNQTRPAATDEGKWNLCIAAKTIREQRELDLKVANERLGKILDLAGKISTQLTASTSAGTNQGDALGSNRPGDLALAAIGVSVEKIVALTGVDEPLMFCIAYLQRPPAPAEVSTTETCLSILRIRAERDNAVRAQVLALSDPTGYRIAVARGQLAGVFRDELIARVKQTSPDKLAATIKAFEDAGGGDLGLGPKCTAVEACISAIQDADIVAAYKANSGQLEGALAAVWKAD